MILLTKGATVNVFVTLSEKVSLDDPYFLFVFENKATQEKVKFVGTDISSYQDRYNKFSVVVNTHFEDHPEGLYNYKIYEQSSSSNTDETGLNLVERGIMKLSSASELEVTEYEGEAETIKVYNGSR